MAEILLENLRVSSLKFCVVRWIFCIPLFIISQLVYLYDTILITVLKLFSLFQLKVFIEVHKICCN
jgi:hypothetical protein